MNRRTFLKVVGAAMLSPFIKIKTELNPDGGTFDFWDNASDEALGNFVADLEDNPSTVSNFDNMISDFIYDPAAWCEEIIDKWRRDVYGEGRNIAEGYFIGINPFIKTAEFTIDEADKCTILDLFNSKPQPVPGDCKVVFEIRS